MLSVTNISGQTEALNGVQGFKMVEDTSRNLSIKFNTLPSPNNPGYALVEEEATVDVEGYLFKVKQLKETRTRKEVSGISIFYDLKGHRQDTIYGGTRKLSEFAAFIFKDTGWTFEVIDGDVSKLIPNFGEDTVPKLVELMCNTFECEMEIMPGKHVIFKKEIGEDNDEVYRYKHNIKTLSRNVDTTNLRTRITGKGGNNLVVTYLSPNHTKFGILDADPIEDEEITTTESMTELLKRTLTDVPEVKIEVEAVELTYKGLGDRVWLIYEPMDIEFKTRILSRTIGLRNDQTLYVESVVLGNTIPKTLGDILIDQQVEIDEARKETRSRFEQTNDRITMEVEEIDSSISAFNIKANEITLNVSNLMGRVAGAEASISIQAGQIQSKVAQYDYNGNAIVSMINQTPDSIKLQANKIDIVGIVTVSDLKTPGKVTIAEGNVTGESFTVGRGTGNPYLTMYSTQGTHRIHSQDGTGFRIQSTGTLSLQADNGSIYANSKLWATKALQVTGITEVQEIRATGIMHAWGGLQINYHPVATESWVANMNYLTYSQMTSYIANLNLTTVSWVNSGLQQLERDIVAWANGKFALK